jgi:putative hemolysin
MSKRISKEEITFSSAGRTIFKGAAMEQTLDGNEIFSILPKNTKHQSATISSLLSRPLEHLLGLRGCQAIYDRVKDLTDPHRFMHEVLSVMKVRPEVAAPELTRIPTQGPAVVVANHPFGGIEGIMLADILLSVRRDVKIMANFLLQRIPQLKELTIPVDPFNRADSARINMAPIRAAQRWVKNGGMLLVFPAGEVSHFNLSSCEISDKAWSTAVGRIVRHAQASVLPIFFQGHNGALFHAAGCIHPCLRTALLARELINKQAKTIAIKIGAPIPFRWLRRYTDDAKLVEHLRWRTYVLGYKPRRGLQLPPALGAAGFLKTRPLASSQPRGACRREIEQLPRQQRLAQSGAFSVWQATSDQIPRVLHEIGRLRELTFREASEGTGKPLDMDRFDSHYQHLFLWNQEDREIVGAYCIAQTDVILKRYGRAGLYTTTLFQSRMAFFKKLGPALELGRSFVRPEYQKSFAPLLLLWKGIGSFISRHPRYRMLFGPVSISRDYSDLSRRLIATTLLQHSQAKDLALMVRPRKPVCIKPIRIPGCRHTPGNDHLQDFKEVCSVIADIEFERREIPVLLRHYLNLGGQLLAFNIDRNFGHVMDGLIVVDLLQTDRKTLDRYMGTEGAAAFISYHEGKSEKAPGDRAQSR